MVRAKVAITFPPQSKEIAGLRVQFELLAGEAYAPVLGLMVPPPVTDQV
jgi:hypothetical protein